MTAFKAPTFNVVGRPDQATGQFPVLEVPATHVLLGPMQRSVYNKVFIKCGHSTCTSVFTDTSSSWRSEDASAPAVHQVPKIERLRPLEDYWATWERLPEIWQWVLYTIRHGYTIQFWKGLPPFSRILPTTVCPWEASA